MQLLLRPTILASLLALAAAPAAAQGLPSLAGARVYGGLSVGPQSAPEQFQSHCVGGRLAAIEGRAGVSSGLVALEVRGSVMNKLGESTCYVADFADVLPPPQEGVQERREFSYTATDPTAAFDARLRFGGTRAMPLVASVGAGRLAGPDVSYLLASVGVRTRGKIRLALDVERDWYHVTYDDVVREWQGGQLVSETSSGSGTKWWDGTGVRAGVELNLF
jgi:hypothetical protein